MMDRIFYRFGHFLPFYPSNNPESQNSKKMKKTPGDIIISQLCTTNDHHDTMVPEIWSFTYPLTTPKIKILRNKKKKTGYIIILHMRTISKNHVMYGF